jgi:hypothetical protein
MTFSREYFFGMDSLFLNLPYMLFAIFTLTIFSIVVCKDTLEGDELKFKLRVYLITIPIILCIWIVFWNICIISYDSLVFFADLVSSVRY